jgi:hypothetical protein
MTSIKATRTISLLTLALGLAVGGCDEDKIAIDAARLGTYQGTPEARRIMGAEMTGIWTVSFSTNEAGDLYCKCTLKLHDSTEGWGRPTSETVKLEVSRDKENAGKYRLRADGTNIFNSVGFNGISPESGSVKEGFLFDKDDYEVVLKKTSP